MATVPVAPVDETKEYQWSNNGFCNNPDTVLEHTSKHDYVLLTAARTPDGTWVGGSLWRHALGTVNNNLLKNNVKFATSKEAVQAEANRILSLGTAEKLTPNARRILEHFRGPSLPLATEPDMLPAPAPAPLQEEPALPWLDCDGNELHEGDKATVLPDVSKRLSGKLVKVLGEYDPQKKSVQVEPVGWEGEGFGILLCYLRRLPVLGENLEEPFDYTTLPHKEEVRAEQDQERAARRQEPVAAFEVAGQAAHEAAQVAAPEPHRIGWAHKDGSQMNHHYDAQGATACGYKRKAGELHFAGEPDKLPRWQRCEKCDEQLVPLAPEPAAAPAPITSADIEEAVDTPTATTAPVYTPTKMKLVPLADIVVTSNTRKVFDETALAELAESIKAQGVIAPITVRLHAGQPGTFELVAGERRYRASKLAEQVTIPAVIRTLTDREFLEVQLLENLQRVDVRPADEASAFSKLLGSNFSAEEIAQRVGKPVKFVLQRAKLVALIPFWMELLEADRLPLVAAHELARLPAHSQVVVKKWFESSHTWDLKQAKPLEASTIRHGINQEVMRQLSGAAFPKEDATLCPAAGPCTTCPKNSANSRGLFEEAGTDAQAGKCLDAVCFGQKKDAFLARRKKEFAGTDVPLISTSYASPPAGALGYKFYDRAKEGEKGAVPALMVDGSEAGAINWVKLSKGAPDAQAVAQDNKAERAAAIRATRVKRVQNELWAEKLRDTFIAELGMSTEIGGAAAHALLDHWLRRRFTFGRTRTPNDLLSYLVAHYGWQEPTEADLVNTWSDKGDSPHDAYLNRQLATMPSVLEKVALFFDLKIREGLEQTEPTAGQFSLVKALPKTYQAEFEISQQVESQVQERYYSKGKKKEATA